MKIFSFAKMVVIFSPLICQIEKPPHFAADPSHWLQCRGSAGNRGFLSQVQSQTAIARGPPGVPAAPPHTPEGPQFGVKG